MPTPAALMAAHPLTGCALYAPPSEDDDGDESELSSDYSDDGPEEEQDYTGPGYRNMTEADRQQQRQRDEDKRNREERIRANREAAERRRAEKEAQQKLDREEREAAKEARRAEKAARKLREQNNPKERVTAETAEARPHTPSRTRTPHVLSTCRCFASTLRAAPSILGPFLYFRVSSAHPCLVLCPASAPTSSLPLTHSGRTSPESTVRRRSRSGSG